MIRRRLFAALVVFLAGLPLQAANRTEILWDTYGVPHIFARNSQELFRAFGWAQAQSHGDLLLRLYGQARGRGAEYFGEQYVATDRWVLTNSIPQRAQQWYDAQSQEFRAYLEAFADGVNAYVKENPAKIVAEAKVVLPVTAVDVLAHTQRVIHFSFVTSPQAVAAAARGPAPPSGPGSNTWAISPARARKGKAMLLANPHLPWSDYFLFYEAQLTAPGVDAYGATLIGFPILGIAFNSNLGWSHTVNTIDAADLYELRPEIGGYAWEIGAKAYETEQLSIKVRLKDGSLRAEPLAVRRSIHGPVVAEREGRPIALRVAGLDQPGMLEQWWDMMRARNLREFETALRRLQIPMFTVMYADKEGHILHLFNGRVPLRPAGVYNWAGIVPGDTAATLWTETHAYQDLPRVLDPPSGWLQNANDPPWTTTFPAAINANRYPSYMAPRAMGFRPQRSAKLLLQDSRITFEELVGYKHSTHMELADRVLNEVMGAARAKGTDRLEKAAEVLEKWDRAADAESRGAVLFENFVRRWLTSPKVFSIPWSESSPRETPRGVADRTAAAAALDAAAAFVEQRFGALDVKWGDVYRYRADGVDLPGNGAPGDPLGVFRVVQYAPDKDQKFRAAGGDSYVAVVEFGRTPRAMALLGYGNSSQPGSKHRSDQLPLLARKQLRPVWRTRGEIQAHLEEKKVF
jgi:acyl-homoserine-lactone acylase